MQYRIAFIAGALLAAALALAACQPAPPAPAGIGLRATAMMTGADGADMGTVAFAQGPNGVLIAVEVTGLPPGGHGFHIHEAGACAPDFAAAGDHFNPGDTAHGFNNPDGWHPGDLPNIYAGADGSARADYFTDAITLADDGEHSVFDADGSAVIIHEKPDSYGADPGAGGRLACGVIQRN